MLKDGNTPLHRIASQCPNIEREVTEALTTTERDARMQRYKELVGKCAGSSDLWLWLGRDQKEAGLLTDALSSLEEAVRLDPQNIEAQTLRNEVAAAARPGGSHAPDLAQ
jgi:cytochrome c-type biogenesis protein CcmH/NrfG